MAGDIGKPCITAIKFPGVEPVGPDLINFGKLFRNIFLGCKQLLDTGLIGDGGKILDDWKQLCKFVVVINDVVAVGNNKNRSDVMIQDFFGRDLNGACGLWFVACVKSVIKKYRNCEQNR